MMDALFVDNDSATNRGTREDWTEQYYLLTSLLYKACRIGDVRYAMVAAEKLKRMVGPAHVLRTLLGMLAEDGDPDDVARIVPMVVAAAELAGQKTGKKETACPAHLFWHCVYAVARARKWYQTDNGRAFETIRQEVKEKELPDINFPSWVFDRHTAPGKVRAAQGKADLRLDGGWDNRWPLAELWEKITGDVVEYEEKVKVWVDYFRASSGQ